MFDGDERYYRRRRPLYTIRMVSRSRKIKRWQIDVAIGPNRWWPLFSLYATHKAQVYAVANWVIDESHILD